MVSAKAELSTDECSLKTPGKVCLSGDVMIGRGIDQILPHPCDPRIHEPFMSSASDYLHLAEQASSPIARPVNLDYVWGAALEELKRARPDAYIINLAVSITCTDTYVAQSINCPMSLGTAG